MHDKKEQRQLALKRPETTAAPRDELAESALLRERHERSQFQKDSAVPHALKKTRAATDSERSRTPSRVGELGDASPRAATSFFRRQVITARERNKRITRDPKGCRTNRGRRRKNQLHCRSRSLAARTSQLHGFRASSGGLKIGHIRAHLPNPFQSKIEDSLATRKKCLRQATYIKQVENHPSRKCRARSLQPRHGQSLKHIAVPVLRLDLPLKSFQVAKDASGIPNGRLRRGPRSGNGKDAGNVTEATAEARHVAVTLKQN